MTVRINTEEKTLLVKQVLTFNNSTKDTIKHIILNDWNNAFSSKSSALAKKYSDEFVRTFHLASEKERGFTDIKTIVDENSQIIEWNRPNGKVDLVKLQLNKPILPFSKDTYTLIYLVKIPDAKFTRYGYESNGRILLKNWFLNPSRYEHKQFVLQSNENLDDIPNAFSDFEIEFELPTNYSLSSNLSEISTTELTDSKKIVLNSKNKSDVAIVVQPTNTYQTYKNEIIEVSCGLEDNRVKDIDKAIIFDRVSRFTASKLGLPLATKILITQEDYARQPFYGLNQLPSFLSPFSNELMFELKFLKTYLNNYLKENLNLNQRKDYWIYDGIQVFLMMQYADEYFPDLKMTGNVANLKILKSYHFINLDFNQQYNYLYMLMARKNLDQPLNEPKNKLIKFNEQIASKYRAGLSFKYLDSYLGNEIVHNTIKEYIQENQYLGTNSRQFETVMLKNSPKDINWFFRTVIETRDLIDYKFGKVTKTEDSITVNIKNKTHTNVPISLYQLKDNQVINKIWITNIKTDSTFVIPRLAADKLTLNYYNEVPEYNLRNNWKSLKGFFFNNRPFKFIFFKDLEEPYYNQIFYVPEVEFNIYDGIALGMRINNRSILNKPFSLSATPMFSSNTGKIVGKFSAIVDDNVREKGNLYNIRYMLTGHRFHYTTDAFYTNLVPSIQFRFRDENLRKNKNEFIQLRQVYVNRDKSEFTIDSNTENYNVFNLKYGNYQSEGTKHYSLLNDLQIANSFGKVATEIHYRKLFKNNRQIGFRFFAGAFMYNSTNSDFFSFGLDRPNDYMFDYDLLGRSETTGIYSQQYVYAEGGLKSKFDTRYANQWMTTLNGTLNIWNWIQIYGDVGMFKNKYHSAKFVYDSGLHLNLVPDYFELFLPVYSSNGFELNSNNYGEKVRFVVTLTPKTLISLFTRKWF
ncbi:aminopeptidase [Flavobacterium channae]|uniref:aminopeptidase n=1 Tax=Flavobacterium channae TaxID=2897181 RepID=UPI001E60BFA4|nr:aminopeptidase [Flavobacterium channae]UGS22756.1 aminopeptidase [Flavobacterium channae]